MLKWRDKRELDDKLASMIRDGASDEDCVRTIADVYEDNLTVRELRDGWAAAELAASLERLVAADLIEIGPQGEAIPLGGDSDAGN